MSPTRAMSDQSAKDDNLVSVVIFDRSYKVRAEEDPAYIEELARYVDTKMKTIAGSTATTDSLKVAILAALNIADEFFKAERDRRRSEAELAAKADELAATLSSSLGSPAEPEPE
ncbi:MAG TPA: cell division protein ZapA [Vicinamibacteria bacterium]|nr:cell division protein ZapA [Vicinamibacteria bacterium]